MSKILVVKRLKTAELSDAPFQILRTELPLKDANDMCTYEGIRFPNLVRLGPGGGPAVSGGGPVQPVPGLVRLPGGCHGEAAHDARA